MNDQKQSPKANPGPSSRMPPQKADEGVFGLSGAAWLLFCLVLLVGITVVGVYRWQLQRFESRAAAETKARERVEENLGRLAAHLGRYELKQLKKKRGQMYADFKIVEEQLMAAHDQSESLFIGPSKQIQSVVAESMEKIEEKKNQLAGLTSDLARSQVALEGGREACVEHIWLLESAAGKDWVNSCRTLNSRKIAKEVKIIKELKLRSHPSPAERQSAQLVINQHKKKIAELEAASLGALTVSPEQILQSYVVDLKRQIGDLRKALASDLAIYRKNYVKAAKSGDVEAKEKIQQLKNEKAVLAAELDLIDEQILRQQSSLQSTSPK